MELVVGSNKYPIVIERKLKNRNTYIRVKKNLSVYVTTNKFTSDKAILKLIDDNYQKIVKMIEHQNTKNDNNEGFYYLGRQYDMVYVDYCDISFSTNSSIDKVFVNKGLDIDKWYKNQAKVIFREHFDSMYEKFSRKIPYPSLKIRKMTTRWGVCNTKLKCITLNLELIKRDTKYLDYVIVHELSHLIYPNHSKDFWELVEENMPEYKKYRKEMKEF